MTEIERAQATIARIEAKLASATDPESHWYYQQCLNGWRAWLKKLERASLTSSASIEFSPIDP